MFGRRQDTIETRVARGSRMLDKRLPDWHRYVKTFRLNIARADRCVLGQVLGSYGEGTDRLELSSRQSIAYGFQARRGLLDNIDEEYEALTREWCREVEQRQRRERMLV